jgi:hypothetical protein
VVHRAPHKAAEFALGLKKDRGRMTKIFSRLFLAEFARSG